MSRQTQKLIGSFVFILCLHEHFRFLDLLFREIEIRGRV